ncbi:hypothetical protein F5984_18195 [Rudanella paleaurantiibacter]|uniref:Lipocalin-like domain-containing protein n=1 Tax=Rudanella paleaurantiibacter TaxID=2614655 RepID=A0A7J5TYF8_9BACT|nr:hypothetical protein [Rudanella paleaurantiibacter]KAB7728758.1 hypothetical protein F5984_18195 [Rudanella paleaurantiibacter]
MKPSRVTPKAFVVLLLSILSTACSDRLQAVRQIDGLWRIESIEYGNQIAKADSIIIPTNLTLSFEKCGSGNNRRVNTCPLYYNQEEFRYRITADDGTVDTGLEIDLKATPDGSPRYSDVSRQLFGNYTIRTLSEEILIIQNDKVDLQNQLPYKWRRITAKRLE